MTQPPPEPHHPTSATPPFDPVFGEVIHACTRRQAIDDGVLIDLTPWAAELGFVYPVACTRAVWDRYVQPPDPVAEGHGQSARGRGHDLLWMLRLAIARNRRSEPTDTLAFEVLFLQRPGHTERVRLIGRCGPGDPGSHREPVITVTLPDED